MENDKLKSIFEKQTRFMEMLRENDMIPEWPLDLTTKPGQRLVRETMHAMQEEMFEAAHTLKNRTHRMTDVNVYDRDHYMEELGDTLAYFVEVCVLSGINADDLYEEYSRKNQIVTDRLNNGY